MIRMLIYTETREYTKPVHLPDDDDDVRRYEESVLRGDNDPDEVNGWTWEIVARAVTSRACTEFADDAAYVAATQDGSAPR